MAQFNSLTDKVRQMLGGMPQTLSDIGNRVGSNLQWAGKQAAANIPKAVGNYVNNIPQVQAGKILAQNVQALPKLMPQFQENARANPIPMKAFEGLVEGSTWGLKDINYRPSQNIGEKAAYLGGYGLGLLNPLSPVNRTAGLLKGTTAVKALQSPLGKIAGKAIAKGGAVGLLGRGVANLSQGLPYTGAYAIGKSVAQGGVTGESIPTDLGIDLAIGSIPVVGGLAIGSKGLRSKAGQFFDDRVINSAKKHLGNEARRTIGQFASLIETSPGANRKNLGAIGDEIQSIAEGIWGNKAKSLTNTQLKNAFDVLLYQLDKAKGYNRDLAFGLSTQDIRGTMRQGEKLTIKPGESLGAFQQRIEESSRPLLRQFNDLVSNKDYKRASQVLDQMKKQDVYKDYVKPLGNLIGEQPNQLDPLLSEAKKYKSAEEFVKARLKGFRDAHRAPSSDFTIPTKKMETGGDFSLEEVVRGFHNQPKDYFDRTVGPRYYSYDNQAGMESATAIDNIRRALANGKKTTITAYRTVPKNIKENELVDYDWVTFSKKYAEDHGMHRFGEGEYKIIKQEVLPKEVWWDGNDINEWGFDSGKTVKKLTDIWNQANKGVESNISPMGKVAQMDQVQPQEVVKATTELKPQLQEAQAQKSMGDALSNGQQNPSSPGSIPEVDPVQKIITALKGAKPIRGQQEAIYSKIRSQQAGALAGIGGQLKGEAGYYQKLGQLKGEMPKVQFESIKKQFTQDELNSLFNKVESSNLGVFEKVNAQTGLRKLLGAEGGTIPTEGELQLLNAVFPPEFIQAVLDNRSTMQKLFTLGENALNLPRAMMATADLSAPLRQGAFLIGRPKQWLPAFRDMFKYAFSENAYKGLQDEIKARPSYQLMRENKLAITDMSPLLQSREEAFMSNLSEQIPIFGRIAKGSNRAYSGFLNKLRADTFDDLLKGAKAQGLDIKENPKLVSDIANFVNTATGRGNLGAFQKAAPILNAAMFSPRLVASRINLLNPVYYTKLEPFVRKEALKSLLSFVGTGATVLALSKLGGAEVGADPRSADFGKIKVGNTRFDIWGGFQQYVRALAQLISGQYISTTTGKTLSLGEGYNAPTRKDILLRFFESKESPVMSFVTSILEGKTATGSAFNLPVEVIDRFIPMVVQDMYDLYKEWGAKGILMGIPGGFGVGSQTYQDRIPMQGKTPMGKPNIQWRQAPSLGEELWNKATGTELSNIPKDQWAPLVEKKKQENLWNIKYSGIKAAVLETGQEQTVQNPITGDSIRVYLDNGVVKTKIITPKKPTLKLKKTSTKKVSKGKSIKIKMAKLKAPKIKRIKIAKVRIKKPLKLARMRVKMDPS